MGGRAAVKTRVGGSMPSGAYSPGIVAEGRYLFVSGQGPVEDGRVVHGTIEAEVRLALRNVLQVLEAAGATPAHVAQCRVYLSDMADFAAMDAVYATFFPDPRPARTTIGAALGDGIKVEIDCVAVLPA